MKEQKQNTVKEYRASKKLWINLWKEKKHTNLKETTLNKQNTFNVVMSDSSTKDREEWRLFGRVRHTRYIHTKTRNEFRMIKFKLQKIFKQRITTFNSRQALWRLTQKALIKICYEQKENLRLREKVFFVVVFFFILLFFGRKMFELFC